MALLQVIKYDGGPDVFAWKYPNEELTTASQLIVNESQEAVLFKGGQALDVFTSGRHTLSTANIPLLNHIVNLPFGGESPFAAEVWYVNKIYSMDIKWGTSTPIQLQDPKYQVFIPLRAHGQFAIQIENAKQFLVKLVGTMPVFDKTTVVEYFRGIYLTKVKDAISSYLVHQKISLLEINAYIEDISICLGDAMRPALEEFGIKLVNFNVNDISVSEQDSAVKQLKDALAKKAEMDIIGYNYQQERSFDTMEGAATNPGSSSDTMGAGMGLGMGLGMGRGMGYQFSNMANQMDVNAETPKKCPQCNSLFPKTKRFCPDCGCDTEQKASQPATTAQTEKKMIQCSKCGKQYAADVKFCPDCGDRYTPCPQCKSDISEGAASCAVCGYELPRPCLFCQALLPSKTTRFCPECGKSQIKTCPACQIEVTEGTKFCPECGKPIEAEGAAK